jgi:ferredoxin, 2Fe-2S
MGVNVTYIQADGSALTVDGAEGASVMETAISCGVDGIVAECGGNMMCATCHVYVDDAWADRVPPVDDAQSEMLEEIAAERRPGSRLSCQVQLAAELDGLVVHVPEVQV